MAVLIGQTDNTGGVDDSFNGGDGALSRWQAVASGNVDTLSMEIRGSSNFTTLKFAIYADSSGSPGALLGQTSTTADNTAGVKTLPMVSSVAVTSGTFYWLALLATGSWIDNKKLSTGTHDYQTALGSSFPNPWGTSTNSGVGGALAIQGDSTGGGASTGEVAYLGAGAAATATSGNVTPAYPGSLQADDILVCQVTSYDNVSVSFGGSGWTKKSETNNGSNLRQTIAWKRRASGDSDTNVVITHTGGDRIIARVHALRNAKRNGDPFEASAVNTPSAAASGTFPNVTTTLPLDLLMYALSYGNDYSTGPSISNAQGLTLTERDETEVA